MSAVGVVIVAGGLGTRLGADRPKALVEVAGEAMVVHAVRRARAAAGVQQVVVVVPASHRAEFDLLLRRERVSCGFPEGGGSTTRALDPDGFPGMTVVEGGAERTDSVAAGLQALDEQVDVVLVHDAARALAPTTLFDAVVAAVRAGADAVVPGLPVTDTVKQVDAAGHVVATPDRSTLRAVQTPQGFARAALERAHTGGDQATDDAALVERQGGTVVVIDGDTQAIKVTHPADLEAVERLAAAATPGAGPEGPALVVLGGLPGVGKTSLARAIARRTPVAHLRVDTIETGLRRVGAGEVPPETGYAIAFEVAGDQLALGTSVVADTVNPLLVTREAWRAVAARHDARVLEIELVCSDPAVHEARVTGRVPDIEGHVDPTWQEVRDREYAAWDPDLRLDTAHATSDDLAQAVLTALAASRQ
ncbi:2-C-methyl-D-erythritol 4-phosphate cytidylyltransferase [Luteipulveratus flavus]|uniref:2-C-methyl-D-erythritol 4-phosphate cytidylyltransferase n=1 Tax=Luteipulveratus flavus TaxID=3031728 RepID=A0ABT6CBV5_9MICO|nr:2-C-methyl-D-erythritol 4-phosphate cytidylyltransferase [Luteipulveratus sp. YIM 133296]MDF8265539.1 2-C-methyl-D-erythritol 4-phosphate cytidylyltransferase [Luteipulveratus sp. YIM 133296]